MVKEFRYNNGYFFDDKALNRVMLWHNCSKKHTFISMSGFYGDNGISLEKCPNCGEYIAEWIAMDYVEHDINGYFIFFDDTTTIKINTDNHKVGVSIYKSSYEAWNGASRLDKKPSYIRLSFNIKTGRTYLISASSFKKDTENKGKTIRDISYGIKYIFCYPLIIPRDALSYICTEICTMMKDVNNSTVPAFESVLTLDNLILYVRCPYIKPALYGKILNWSRRHWRGGSSILKDLSVKNDCKNPIEQIFMQSKIPKVKSLKRIVFTNPESLSLLALISQSFKNVDIIRSIYRAYIGSCGDRDDPYLDFSAKIIKTMIKHKGEKVIASKIISFLRQNKNNNAYITLCDMIRAYDELKQCDFDFFGSYSIDELHMYLAISVATQERENREIHYSSGETALTTTDECFSLCPAKDTFELITVGTKMNICVGSYAYRVINKECSIFILRDVPDNKPLGCIEMHDDAIVQVKGHGNTLLTGAPAAFVEKWIKDNSLIVDTGDISCTVDECVDITNDLKVNVEQLCELWVQESLW